MQGNATIAVIIGGLTGMGLVLWGSSYLWLHFLKKWAETVKAKQNYRNADIERANTTVGLRTPPSPRNPSVPRVRFALPVARTARRPQKSSPGSTDTSDLTETSSAS
jgi:hypothetical protein